MEAVHLEEELEVMEGLEEVPLEEAELEEDMEDLGVDKEDMAEI